ncbi:hypothetical protein F5Y15DRAFT_420692 [Xylariaceae sp. FL0016]|nr:hypothetical protein F5Y15DRAFT_420692 [Xylariaceae sp. FL0016]
MGVPTGIDDASHSTTLAPTNTTGVDAPNNGTGLPTTSHGGVPAPADLDNRTDDTASPSTINAPAADAAVTTEPTYDVIPAIGSDEPGGKDLAADIWRYTYRCTDSRRRVPCVTYFDSYCDAQGFIHTENAGYCGNNVCWCHGYDAIACNPLRNPSCSF